MIKLNLILISLCIFFYISYCDKINNNNDQINFLPTKEFENSQIISPQIQYLRNKISINNEHIVNSDLYPNEIILRYEGPNKNTVIASLTLNKDLQGHFIQIQSNTSKLVEYPYNHELCQYRGTIQGDPQSDIILSLCGNQINGVILSENGTHYIYSKVNNSKIEHHLIKDSDVLEKGRCGLNTTNTDQSTNNKIILHKYKRSINSVHGPYNANLKTLFIELVLVVDNSLYNSFNRDVNTVHQYCKDLINIVNGYYSPLNIHVTLIGIVIWSERDEIRITGDSVETLNNFLEYRQTKLLPIIPNDNAVLLTNKIFDNRVAGKALVGTMCTASLSGAVISKHSSVIAIVASTIAHEIGHNLGMKHDEDEDSRNCYCPQDKCMMTQGVDATALEWSDCSKKALYTSFTNGLTYCLKNKPTKLFKSSSCGNSFVEPGEECDCGLPKYCKNKCCDPKTCRLRGRAFCATGECCDLNTCKLKKTNTNCRLSTNECDISEYCDGRSEYCPEDNFKEDATVCENGLSYCFQGKCGSRQQRCEKIWGPYAEIIKECYSQNLLGSRHGNCGYDKFHQFKKCEGENIQCGALLCTHKISKSRLKDNKNIYPHVTFGGNWVYDSKSSHRYCQTAALDISSPALNLGLTPNGAVCGNKKMCVNQTCVNIDSIRKRFQPSCPGNCYNNGICNKNGTCTCDTLYAPPFCADYDYSYYDTNEIVPGVKLVPRMQFCNENCTGSRFCTPKGICICRKGYTGPNCAKIEKSVASDNNYTNIIIYICLAILLIILIAVVIYITKKQSSEKSQSSPTKASILKRNLSIIENLFTNVNLNTTKDKPSPIPKGQLF